MKLALDVAEVKAAFYETHGLPLHAPFACGQSKIA